ncbi:MAG: DUF4838 domain-containing protein, partial [Verrucomicrobiia bacterium]
YDKAYWQPAARARRHKIMEGWRKACSSVVLTTYFHGMPWWSLPMPSPEALADLIQTSARFESSLGVYVGMALGQSAFGTQGNEYVLAAELMWNPRRNIEEVLVDYSHAAFGPAAPLVRDYFKLLENAHARQASALPSMLDEMVPLNWVVPTYTPVRAQADRLMAQAAIAVRDADAALQKRVRMVVEGWEWTKIQTDVLAGLQEFQKSRSVEKARDMLELLRRREAFLAAHAAPGDYTISVPEVRVADKQQALSVGTGEYEALVSGKRQVLKVPMTDEKPANETPLASLPWGTAVASASFVQTLGGEVAPVKTRVRLLAGKESLLMEIECEEPDMAKLVASVTQRDGEVWNDDVVEVFLVPSGSGTRTYHLLVNPLGTLTDAVHDGEKMDAGWNSHARVETKRLDKVWKVWLEMPYRSLGMAQPPLPADVWKVNFCRSRRAGGRSENLAWSPTFGLFFRPERFGELVFEQRQDR